MLILILSVYCAILTFTLALIFIFPVAALLVTLLFIRFKSTKLKGDHFIYRDSSILPFFNEERSIALSDIFEVKLIPKHTNRAFILADILFTTFYRGQTGPQTVSLKMDDGTFSFISFGNKDGLDELLMELQRRIKQ